ncbi:MAG: glycosyltransferase family 4 protein [Anaerolineales bacterium]
MQNTTRKRSVCFILPGLNRLNLGVQPWRYVTETAAQLYRAGHRVTILSEAGPRALTGFNGVPVRALRSVGQTLLWRNAELRNTIEILKPDVLVWNLGLHSFLHQDYRTWNDRPQVGFFSSLVYSPREILRPGLARLAANRFISGAQLLGAFAPRWLLRARAARLGLNVFVTQTEMTRWALYAILQKIPVRAIRPGVDSVWLNGNGRSNGMRESLGLSRDDFVVLYFDSPAPLRGLSVLVEALARARQKAPNLKLVALNRRYLDETHPASQSLESLVMQKGLGDAVRFVDGVLEPEALVEIARSSDLAALPYEFVSSDSPLAVLEAVAARKPVLTSRLACLPELASHGRAFLAEPGDPESVAEALLEAWRQAPVGPVPRPGVVRGWEAVGAEWSAFLQSL